ncbi:MAG: DUF1778 domain-containing protein [Mycobacteriales bacterium]
MVAPTARLEVRLDVGDKELLEQAAFASHETLTAFVVRNVRTAALQTLRRERVTVVPAEFYDRMIASLDAEPQPNQALSDAARRLNSVVAESR